MNNINKKTRINIHIKFQPLKRQSTGKKYGGLSELCAIPFQGNTNTGDPQGIKLYLRDTKDI